MGQVSSIYPEAPEADDGLLAKFVQVDFSLRGRCLLQGCHVDDEAVSHISLCQACVGFIDLLDWDELDIGGDASFGAEIQHLLCLPDAADCRPGDGSAQSLNDAPL